MNRKNTDKQVRLRIINYRPQFLSIHRAQTYTYKGASFDKDLKAKNKCSFVAKSMKQKLRDFALNQNMHLSAVYSVSLPLQAQSVLIKGI